MGYRTRMTLYDQVCVPPPTSKDPRFNRTVVWYRAPRNPAIPSPFMNELVATTPLAKKKKSEQARINVYLGDVIPPSQRSLAGIYDFRLSEKGYVLVPVLSAAAADPVMTLARKAASLGLQHTLSGVDLRAANLAFNALWPRAGEDLKKFDALFDASGMIAIPFVDVVEAARGVTKDVAFGKGVGLLMNRQLDYTVFHCENSAGMTRSYTLIRPLNKKVPIWKAGNETIAGISFRRRIDAEIDFLRNQILLDLVDWVPVYEEELGKLGLTIPPGLKGTLADQNAMVKVGLQAAIQSGRSLTAAQLVGVLTATQERATMARDLRMGPDNAAKELYSLVLERLRPVLADYRVVPMMAEAIEILEHMSRVGNDPQHTVGWSAVDYPTNFLPGKSPRGSGQ